MPNIYNSKNEFFQLSQVGKMVENIFAERFGGNLYWIMAEISSLHLHKGHCYMSLIEKAIGKDDIKTEIKGIVWNNNYGRLSHNFKQITGFEIKEDTKILFLGKVSFDTKYGLSLIIEEIDPTYTMGQLLIERENVVRLLKEKGFYDLNRGRAFPLVPQRIAVISADNSRGYEDFRETLLTNKHNYKFNITLYQSLLQGEKAAEDMRNRLIDIYNSIYKFDIVVIVRGGGGNVNLNCFNNYRLTEAIARFPIPVITGIGHTANISVADEVAYKDCITPTDVAVFIINRCYDYDRQLMKLFDNIKLVFANRMSNEIYKTDKQYSLLLNNSNNLLKHLNRINESFFIRFVNSVRSILTGKHNRISLLLQKLGDKLPNYINKNISLINHQATLLKPFAIKIIDENAKYLNNRLYILKNISDKIFSNNKRFTDNALIYLKLNSQKIIEKENKELFLKETKVKMLDPVNILKRGYSITLKEGGNIKSSNQLKEGDEVRTILFEGEIISKVKTKK